jgi:hypothetical protein
VGAFMPRHLGQIARVLQHFSSLVFFIEGAAKL